MTQIVSPGVKIGTTSLVPFGYIYTAFPTGYSAMPTDAIWLASVPPATVRNATVSQLTVTSATVPEPSALPVFLAAGLVLFLLKNARRRIVLGHGN